VGLAAVERAERVERAGHRRRWERGGRERIAEAPGELRLETGRIEFEEAARLRDLIASIAATLEQQKVIDPVADRNWRFAPVQGSPVVTFLTSPSAGTAICGSS
jgi:hypothetical protein